MAVSFRECNVYIYIYIPGGGFKYFLFSPLPGEMIQFDYSDGPKLRMPIWKPT